MLWQSGDGRLLLICYFTDNLMCKQLSWLCNVFHLKMYLASQTCDRAFFQSIISYQKITEYLFEKFRPGINHLRLHVSVSVVPMHLIPYFILRNSVAHTYPFLFVCTYLYLLFVVHIYVIQTCLFLQLIRVYFCRSYVPVSVVHTYVFLQFIRT